MKTSKIYILTLISILSASLLPIFAVKATAQQSTYKMDTVMHRFIGPGVTYTRFVLPDQPLCGYLLKVDLNNPYNRVETFQAYDETGRTEAMSNAFGRLTNTNHRTLAGVNGNFWIVSGQGMDEMLGVPHSGSMKNAEMVTDPNNWNRPHGAIGFAMIDSDKKVWIDDIAYAGVVKTEDKGDFPIAQINRTRGQDQLIFFNNYLGTKPTRSDDNGIEVFARLTSDSRWGINADVKCVVTRIIEDKGANILQEGEIVLSGNGLARAFLEKLSVGDEFAINMSVKTVTDEQFPQLQQMVTGNALVMKDGVLTNRNYNESYNTMLYPRTGIATSKDRKTLFLIVIDKGPLSKGATTATMCELLQFFGAYDAASMDGGGSAQMMVDGAIVNKPADGKERSVANGWFLFHTADDDKTIARLEFADHKIRVPMYASYTPTILGYNQYGVLVDEDVRDFTLTCSEGIGVIRDEKTFIAAGTAGTGTLTATLNGISVEKGIGIIEGSIELKCDSVILDNRSNYPIEMYSISGNNQMIVDPGVLEWRVEDPEVCSVENGVLKAVKNGITTVIGTLNDLEKTLKVIVEIPPAASIVADSIKVNEWKLTASSFLNAQLNTVNLPRTWETGAVVNFVYKTGRAPYFTLSHDKRFYGLPDTVKITLNLGEVTISRTIFTFKNNLSVSATKEFNSFETNKDITFIIPVDELFDANDRAIYPIRFDNMKFFIQADGMLVGQSYSPAVKDIVLVYKDFVGTGLNGTEANLFAVYPNPIDKNGAIHIRFLQENPRENITVRLFDLTGRKIKQLDFQNLQSNELSISLTDIQAGTYLMQVNSSEKSQSVKIIVK